jgi:hypothetical protein
MPDTPSPTPEPSLDAELPMLADRDDIAAILVGHWGCDDADESAYDMACRDFDAITAGEFRIVHAAALTEEREAHQRDRQAWLLVSDELDAAEAALQARERELDQLTELREAVEALKRTRDWPELNRVFDVIAALAPPTPQTPKEDG